jgi:hypothetical protein
MATNAENELSEIYGTLALFTLAHTPKAEPELFKLLHQLEVIAIKYDAMAE